MAVFKSAVQVCDSTERSIGEGMAYIRPPRGREVAQDASGTVSLRRWEPAEDPPTHTRLEDGRRLAISVDRSLLSDCSRNHILRFTAVWSPGQDGDARTGRCDPRTVSTN